MSHRYEKPYSKCGLWQIASARSGRFVECAGPTALFGLDRALSKAAPRRRRTP
jgi:hypothetical protein